jgi:hypothetical protein
MLQKGPIEVRQLVPMLTSEGHEQVGDAIREMIDQGEVCLDNGTLLRLGRGA